MPLSSTKKCLNHPSSLSRCHTTVNDTIDSNRSLMYLEIVLPLILNLPYNVIKARRRRVIKDWKRSHFDVNLSNRVRSKHLVKPAGVNLKTNPHEQGYSIFQQVHTSFRDSVSRASDNIGEICRIHVQVLQREKPWIEVRHWCSLPDPLTSLISLNNQLRSSELISEP